MTNASELGAGQRHARGPLVALELWGGDPRLLMRTAVLAERVGLDAVYVGESPTPLNAETWTTLGLIAAATSRLRLGPVITNLLDDYRSPVLLARQAATLALATDGRLDFRTAVGATHDAGRRWWQPAGVDYPRHARRWAMADRQLRIMRRLWNGSAVDLGDGPFSLGFDHPAIPVTIAARGPHGLALVRQHADRWETSHLGARDWLDARRSAGLDPHIDTSLEVDGFIGRDDGAGVWARASTDRADEDLEPIRRRSLFGGVEAVSAQIRAFSAVGIDQLVVALHEPHDEDAIATLAAARELAQRPA